MNTTHSFFEQPILNSPYKEPLRHWELQNDGQPTHTIKNARRPADFITPFPKPKKQTKKQGSLLEDETALQISSDKQEYHKAIINEIRFEVKKWRSLPKPQWKVTAETAILLEHWRHHVFAGIRPFFCQIEAAETAIWLTEAAPRNKKFKDRYIKYLEDANNEANPELFRIALKLATGAGKTTVMAMLIAWQTINAVRYPGRKEFSKGFLVVAPGITIKDRLRVLLPNDPDSYYASRELVPPEMLQDLQQARIVITNYHAFKLREKIDISKGTRSTLEGWEHIPLQTTESEGEMLHRVMPELTNLKSVMVINDEAHHCYREKAGADALLDEELSTLSSSDKSQARDEARENREAARLWISGLEAVKRKIGINVVCDLSATPFFLSGSGYAEGTIFPWTMSDFSLMDALECGIVKLPRIPIADNISGSDMPMYRELWKHISKEMPKKGKGKDLDPLKLPIKLQTALSALYSHYEKVFQGWKEEDMPVPPCFVIVCNNTSSSKLVYDYISGFKRQNEDNLETFENGRLPLFRNFDENGTPLARPNTLLIDSMQLESGSALDSSFKEAAKDEIARFRREIEERGGKLAAELSKNGEIPEEILLREVMNTVGKKGQLGENIRCVVSVSMLTEGWDANNVTHILGIRAFGTQLLCEQVIGRALRRQSYELTEDGLFHTEYADILGIPFDFAAKPVIARFIPPRETVNIKSVHPDRDSLEITFPRVTGYRTEIPNDRLKAAFTAESEFVLTPGIVGATVTHNAAIIGEAVDLRLNLEDVRENTILMVLTKHLLLEKFRDAGKSPKLHLFGQLKSIAAEWYKNYFRCIGGTKPAQLLYLVLADTACDKIAAAITNAYSDNKPVKAILAPYNPTGSTRHVNFHTSKKKRWECSPLKSHINYAILDSDWEGEFCRVVESHPAVISYAKNQNLGFEVPYTLHGETHSYIPDFLLLIDDHHDDPLHLIVEIKGFRREDAVVKKMTMDTYWIPGVNNLKEYGRWAFMEFRSQFSMEEDFAEQLNKIIHPEKANQE